MKALTILLFVLLSTTGFGQDVLHSFEASKILINRNGQNSETSTVDPSKITVDIQSGTVTVETSNTEVQQMLENKTVLPIQQQMGQMRSQYSLKLGEFLLAHFYTDMGMIIFTRTDMHPLQWGIQFQEVQKL